MKKAIKKNENIKEWDVNEVKVCTRHHIIITLDTFKEYLNLIFVRNCTSFHISSYC